MPIRYTNRPGSRILIERGCDSFDLYDLAVKGVPVVLQTRLGTGRSTDQSEEGSCSLNNVLIETT